VVRFTIVVLPWIIPGLALSMAIALVACRRLANLLSVRRPIAWTIIVGFGLIVSATLTPLRGVLDLDSVVTGVCDFLRTGIAPVRELLRLNDTSLNVALFIPLGIAIGLVGRSGPRAIVSSSPAPSQSGSS